MIDPKPKICRGINKARGFEGCGGMFTHRTHGLCRQCYAKWLYTTEDGKQKLTRAKISPRSSKRKAQESEYSRLRKSYLATNPRCERCGIPATDIHHKNGRRGERLNDTEYFMSVCRSCHDWIHDNPKEAKGKGWFA